MHLSTKTRDRPLQLNVIVHLSPNGIAPAPLSQRRVLRVSEGFALHLCGSTAEGVQDASQV